MISLKHGKPYASSYITPLELMDEIDEVASVFNALDRDNFPAVSIDETKVANGAWNLVHAEALTNTVSTSQNDGQEGTIYAIPDTSSSDPWVVEYASTDTVLEVSLFTCTEAPEGGNYWVGLRVAGTLVRSPWTRGVIGYESQLVRAFVPVGPNTQLIEAIYGYRPSSGGVQPYALNWEHRRIAIRELVR